MLRPVARILVPVLACAALTLAACGTSDEGGGPSTLPTARAPLTFTGGSTILAIDPQTAGVLEDNQVEIGAAAPATMDGSALSFPINGGGLDGRSLGGAVTHDGGVRFTSDTASVVVRDLRVDTLNRQVTGAAGKGRLPLFDLDQRKISSSVPSPGGLNATGVVALLSPRAAHALNAALKVSVFTPKLIIGDVSIDATG